MSTPLPFRSGEDRLHLPIATMASDTHRGPLEASSAEMDTMPVQLSLWMTPHEILNGSYLADSTAYNDDAHLYASKLKASDRIPEQGQHAGRMSRINRFNTGRSLTASIRAEGVRTPVKMLYGCAHTGNCLHSKTPRPALIDGHHRTVVAHSIDPHSLVPVVFDQYTNI